MSDTGDARLTAGEITRPLIADNAVGGDEIAPGSVDNRHIAPGTVEGGTLRDGAVTNPKMGADSVDNESMHDHAIDGDKIRDRSITTRHIDSNAILGRSIGTREITGNHISPYAVGSRHIQNGAIDTFKIGFGQVRDEHIWSVPYTKIDFEGNPLIPGGVPGQLLTRTLTGLEWRDPPGTRWEVLTDTTRNIGRGRDIGSSSRERVTLLHDRRLDRYSQFVFQFIPVKAPPFTIPRVVLTASNPFLGTEIQFDYWRVYGASATAFWIEFQGDGDHLSPSEIRLAPVWGLVEDNTLQS